MSILQKIVDRTKEHVAKQKQLIPPATLATFPFFQSPTLSLAKSLKKQHLTVIAELKKASPSKGIIRPDFHYLEFAKQYKHAGASAISVLTEPFFFKGSLSYLEEVRKISDLPLLRKDFIIDPYQLLEARAYGADAVLLIAAILEKTQLKELHQVATALGLSCLVELYDAREIEKIDFNQVKILGVNNRNLHTFEVNLDHSLQIFSQVPENVIKVGESGLASGKDLAYLRRSGIDAVLIGETFMRARKPGDKLKSMLQETEEALKASPLRLVV